jgi:hypothetical protein
MIKVATPIALAAVLGLGACAVAPPTGPSFAAMPGQGKNFEQFQADDFRCRQIAQGSIGNTSPAEAANQSAIGSAAVGTGVGAAVGALAGAAGGAPGIGAAAGAGAGLLAGSAIGANNAAASGAALQQRYDITYAQCMAAAGESVPNPTAGPPGYPYPYGGYPAYPYPPAAYYPPPVFYPPVELGIGFGWGGGWGHWHRW